MIEWLSYELRSSLRAPHSDSPSLRDRRGSLALLHPLLLDGLLALQHDGIIPHCYRLGFLRRLARDHPGASLTALHKEHAHEDFVRMEKRQDDQEKEPVRP